MDKKTKILVVLTSIMPILLLASNIMATKIWDFHGIPVDGGLLLYPLSYVAGDILMELYGKRVADFSAKITVIFNAIAVCFLSLVIVLPPYFGYDGQEAYEEIFALSARITFGSLVGYLLSQLTNNWAFFKILVWQKHAISKKAIQSYKLRAIGSSLIGRVVDVITFEVIAFFGILPLEDFLKQAIGAYFEGLIIEVIIVLFISNPIIKIIKKIT